MSDQFTYTGYSNYGLNYNYPNTQDNIYQNEYRPKEQEYHPNVGMHQNNNYASQWEPGVTDIGLDSRNRVGDQVRVNQGVRTWATGEGMPSWVHGRVYPVIEIRTRGGATELLLGGGINSWIRQSDVTAATNAAAPAPQSPPTATVRVNDRVRVKQGVGTWATGEGMPSWVHGRIYPVIEIRKRGGVTELLLGSGINSWIRATDVRKVSQTAAPATPTTPTATIRVNDRVRVNSGVGTWATGEGMPSWVHGRTYKVIEKRTRDGVKQLLLGDINSWIRQRDVTKV